MADSTKSISGDAVESLSGTVAPMVRCLDTCSSLIVNPLEFVAKTYVIQYL